MIRVHLSDEVRLTGLCRALNSAADLSSEAVRRTAYARHGFPMVTAADDDEATRRQGLRRRLLGYGERIAEAAAFGLLIVVFVFAYVGSPHA